MKPTPIWACIKCGYSWSENPGHPHTRFKHFPDCDVEATPYMPKSTVDELLEAAKRLLELCPLDPELIKHNCYSKGTIEAVNALQIAIQKAEGK